MVSSPLFLTGSQCLVPPNGSFIEKHWFGHLQDQYIGGANIITSKAAFSAIGGFNIDLKTGEDYDFCIRAIKAGIDYSKNQAFEAVHLGFPKDIKGFVKRECWHGVGDFKSLKFFFSSPVAMIAVLYLLLTFSAVLGIFFQSEEVYGSALVTLLFVNMAITVKRFGKTRSVKTILCAYGINFLYFFARIASLYKAKIDRKKIY